MLYISCEKFEIRAEVCSLPLPLCLLELVGFEPVLRHEEDVRVFQAGAEAVGDLRAPLGDVGQTEAKLQAGEAK